MKKYIIQSRNFVLNGLLKLSDRMSLWVFKRQNTDAVIEMGVHQGEIARHYFKALGNAYIGYEANIHNINKYGLKELNVQNYAVVPREVRAKKIELNIPIRNKGDDLTSGKSSVLTRDMTGWYDTHKIQVETIQVNKMPFLNDQSVRVGVWIDIEGISTEIANEVSRAHNVNFMHFEYDMNNEDYEENVFRDLDSMKENYYLLRFRTSHNQFNYLASRRRSFLLTILKCLAEMHNMVIEILLLPGKLLKKR